ncbi:TonB-dependent siderophore receptor [Thiothrix subterranea]|uniref:TonB-dependent siderophore receptor n=1 Tax=Thiothrix subterranea TaxID=2735563 RepID=UPI00192B5920|nr:TonB-dependent siderophore receptor [Thiothrix subterranea]QQZ27628.1 TonB-dependent siderophore receptor [Thiothrix subterranea]
MLKRSALCLAILSALAPLSGFADPPAVDALADITVMGSKTDRTSAGEVDGYQAFTADSATKTRTPLKKIPQSVQVVPNKLMKDQQVQSVSETLRNVSGVVPNNPLTIPGWEATLVRGFSAEQAQDGANLNYNLGDRESTVNIERIEVLKGPNAVLYGGSSGTPVGGTVNLVSKQPEKEKFGKVGITIGSHDLLKPSFDLNQPLSETAQLRVTGEYTQSKSQVEGMERESYNLNPTLKLTDNAKTTLTLQGKTSRWEGQDYQGLPATGTIAGDFKINRDLFLGNKDLPNSTSALDSLAANLDHQLNDTWSVAAKVRTANSDFDEKGQTLIGGDGFTANAPTVGSSWGVTNVNVYQEQQDVSVTADVKGEFKTEKTKTEVLVGVEHSTLDDEGFMDTDGAEVVDLTNPVFALPYTDPNTAFRWAGKVANKTSGVYAQAQHSMNDRVHVLGGAKLAKVEVVYADSFGADENTSETKLLPRAGVVVDMNANASAFASYSEGLRGVGWANYSDTPKPIESKQTEAGIKFSANQQLSGSVAAFQIDRDNTGIPDPATGGMTSLPNGAERSKGAEVDVVWQPNPGFSLTANYAKTDATYTKAAGAIPAGNKLAGVPEHSGRVWGNYTFKTGKAKGVSVGAGVYAQSEAMLTGSNDFKAPAFHTVDAKVGYETKRFETALTVKNLTNEQYFERFNYFSGRVAPGADRTVYLSTAIKF